MASKAGQITPETTAPADVANDTAARLTTEAQKAIADAAKRIEAAVQEGVAQLRAQSRVYADAAGEGIDQAGQYVSEQVRARPIASIGAALGVGVIIGLLLGSSRR
jgi:ElaB/YqjD/DUF883 family membrane-anchored ribosome-binding protein